MAAWYSWLALFIVLGAIAAAVVVILWSQKHKKPPYSGGGGGGGSSSGRGLAFADDVQTGEIMELALVTGSTGASSDSGFLTVLSTTIKTDSSVNRLYSTVSAFTSIATVDGTTLSGGVSFSTEVAMIEVQVLVDGVLALPGVETFNSLTHILTTDLAPEEVILIAEDRGQSSSFDFVTRGVLPGTHTIEVQARAVASASVSPATLATCIAIIGDRTLVVQPGRVHIPCPPSSSSSSSSSITSSSISS